MSNTAYQKAYNDLAAFAAREGIDLEAAFARVVPLGLASLGRSATTKRFCFGWAHNQRLDKLVAVRVDPNGTVLSGGQDVPQGFVSELFEVLAASVADARKRFLQGDVDRRVGFGHDKFRPDGWPLRLRVEG